MSLSSSVFCRSCQRLCADPVILPCCSGNVCENCAKFKLAKQKVCFLCEYSSHTQDNATNRIDVDIANNNAEDVIEEGVSEYENLVKHDKSFYCRVLSSTDCGGPSKSLQIKAYVQGFNTEGSRVEGDQASESFIKMDDFEIDAGKSFLGDNGIPIERVKSVLTKEGVGNKTLTSQWSHEVAQNMASLVLCKSLDKIIKSLKRKYQNNREGMRVLDDVNKPKLPTKIVDIASKKKDSFASALMENAKKRHKSTNADIFEAKKINLPFVPALAMKGEDDVRLDTSKQRKSFGNSSDELQCFNISERSYSISDFGRDKTYSISDRNGGTKFNQPGDVGNDVKDCSEERERSAEMTDGNDVEGHREVGERTFDMVDGNDVKGHREEGERTVDVADGNDVKDHSEEGDRRVDMADGNDVNGHSEEGERTVEMPDGNDVKDHSEEGERTVDMVDGNDVKGHSEEWETTVEMTDGNASDELPLIISQTDKAVVNHIHFSVDESANVESKANAINCLKNLDNDTKSVVGGLVQKIDDFENLSAITEGDLGDTSSDIMDVSGEKWPSLEAEIISSPDTFASTSNRIQDYVSSKGLLGIVALQTEVISSSENFTNSESLTDCLSSISSVENFSGC